MSNPEKPSEPHLLEENDAAMDAVKVERATFSDGTVSPEVQAAMDKAKREEAQMHIQKEVAKKKGIAISNAPKETHGQGNDSHGEEKKKTIGGKIWSGIKSLFITTGLVLWELGGLIKNEIKGGSAGGHGGGGHDKPKKKKDDHGGGGGHH